MSNNIEQEKATEGGKMPKGHDLTADKAASMVKSGQTGKKQ